MGLVFRGTMELLTGIQEQYVVSFSSFVVMIPKEGSA